MTISLILARPGKGTPNAKNGVPKDAVDTEYIKKRRNESVDATGKVKGGTLIICPMALLGQWKVSNFNRTMIQVKKDLPLGYLSFEVLCVLCKLRMSETNLIISTSIVSVISLFMYLNLSH